MSTRYNCEYVELHCHMDMFSVRYWTTTNNKLGVICDTCQLLVWIQVRSINMEIKSKSICDVCGKKFEKKFNKLWHRQIHQEGEKQFSCDKCPKTFTTRQCLVQHSKSHEENSILCKICDKICIMEKIEIYVTNVITN